MYKHEVRIDKSDLEDIMNAAKIIHVDEMIWERRGDYVQPHKAIPVIKKKQEQESVDSNIIFGNIKHGKLYV